MGSPSAKERSARNNRQEQLFVEQRHAWVHHYNRIGAADCSGYSTTIGAGLLKCPTCLRTKPLAEFSEEHAPQKSKVSIFGEATTIVLTCKTCNDAANQAFERDAARPTVQTRHDLPGGCPAHGTRVDESGLVLRVVDELPVVLADIKSAFILAFATLGYGWSTANGVKPIRAAARSGNLPPDGTVAIVKLAGGASENAVLQFYGRTRGVAVVGTGGQAVLLPSHGTRAAPAVDGSSVRMRAWPWPITNGPHGLVDKARRAGNLFHADFCTNHTW